MSTLPLRFKWEDGKLVPDENGNVHVSRHEFSTEPPKELYLTYTGIRPIKDHRKNIYTYLAGGLYEDEQCFCSYCRALQIVWHADEEIEE